jgi:hypothetical protein
MNEKWIKKARKEHKCTYCGGNIPKGIGYIKVQITPWCHAENDSFDTWKIHLECKEVGDEFYWDDDAKGIFPEPCAKFLEKVRIAR